MRDGAGRTPRDGAPEPGAGRRLRVLVVDDETSICRALAIAFERAGCSAVTAPSGEAALGVLHAGRVDVLVLDLRIPDMRGDALFHLAAALQPHLRRQTMFITGDVTDRALALIGGCGAPYVRKPFQLTDVIETAYALAPREGEGLGRRA